MASLGGSGDGGTLGGLGGGGALLATQVAHLGRHDELQQGVGDDSSRCADIMDKATPSRPMTANAERTEAVFCSLRPGRNQAESYGDGVAALQGALLYPRETCVDACGWCFCGHRFSMGRWSVACWAVKWLSQGSLNVEVYGLHAI